MDLMEPEGLQMLQWTEKVSGSLATQCILTVAHRGILFPIEQC